MIDLVEGNNKIHVYLNDTGRDWETAKRYFVEVDRWAQDYCASYIGHHVQDVSDFSMYHDLIAVYVFGDDRDAVAFKLKWA